MVACARSAINEKRGHEREYTVPKDEVLNKYLSEHLPYEFGMLRQTFRRFNEIETIEDGVLRNAIIESFCIHARNLKAFVTNDRGKGSNCVIAKDFVKTFHERPRQDLKGAFQRINEQVEHLAKNRDSVCKFSQSDARETFDWLRQTMCRFVQALDPKGCSEWGRATIKADPLPSSTNYSTSISWSVGSFD